MTVSDVLKNGFSIGIKNFFSLAGAVILYLLTIWVPYINVGTTIALYTLPAAMSRGEIISPTEIFDSKYRRNMGNFFLLSVFLSLGIFFGLLFLIIPGIVLMYTWSLAILLLVDKGLNPMQALNESNVRTYGHKLTIFLSYLILGILYFVLSSIIPLLTGDITSTFDLLSGANYYNSSPLQPFLQILIMLLYYPIQMGITAEIYRKLCSDN
jgi:uncharacterized BrkB/YihY/UPF0761 family membrane protein